MQNIPKSNLIFLSLTGCKTIYIFILNTDPVRAIHTQLNMQFPSLQDALNLRKGDLTGTHRTFPEN